MWSRWRERRDAAQHQAITQIHAGMAGQEGPVGELARLYDRLCQLAGKPDAGISYRGEITHERHRAMYIGGVAFSGSAVDGPVAVNIRRSTMWSRHETHAELTVILNAGQSRIRARVYPHHRDSSHWLSEGSFTGSARQLSEKAPQLKDMGVVGLLVERVVLLADSIQGGEAVALGLPFTPPPELPSALPDGA